MIDFNDFLTIESNIDLTKGKYASKVKSFYDDLDQYQNNNKIKKYKIKPIQFTFEITNRCNCNCKDCGMHANSKVKKDKLTLEELYFIIDNLYDIGIPSYGVTGGEPFLEFNNLCKMIEYAQGKIDIIKLITNGFWGNNPKFYFDKLIQAGFLNNKMFCPSIYISIGEQNVPLKDICSLIKYVTDNFSINDFHFGIINTRKLNENYSKIEQLYDLYEKLYGKFPKNRIFLTDSYYVNVDGKITEEQKINVSDAIKCCDNKFETTIGQFVSPKIFMKCNGDCYPCEVFNLHNNFFIGNLLENNIDYIVNQLNSNKYVKFIHKYGTSSFSDVIDKKILSNNFCETSCQACEFCINFCENNNLISDYINIDF